VSGTMPDLRDVLRNRVSGTMPDLRDVLRNRVSGTMPDLRTRCGRQVIGQQRADDARRHAGPLVPGRGTQRIGLDHRFHL
jgi:hypothetical protein